jgi:DNA-binding transcriptional MerR regulator
MVESMLAAMADEGQMTIEELASKAETATTTVRMYQSRGLLPPPERHGRIGYYGQGHLARLRLIAQLQEQGFSLASIKRLTDAWEDGRSLDDVLGLETQVAGVLAAEQPARYSPARFAALFSGQRVTPAVIARAIRMGLISFDGRDIVVHNPRFADIGAELAKDGIPITQIMDELEALQSMADEIAGRFVQVFERHRWEPFVKAGLPADQIRPLTESLSRLSTLAQAVVETSVRDALRRKAGEFLAEQATRLDDAGVRDGLRPFARAAGLDL